MNKQAFKNFIFLSLLFNQVALSNMKSKDATNEDLATYETVDGDNNIDTDNYYDENEYNFYNEQNDILLDRQVATIGLAASASAFAVIVYALISARSEITSIQQQLEKSENSHPTKILFSTRGRIAIFVSSLIVISLALLHFQIGSFFEKHYTSFKNYILGKKKEEEAYQKASAAKDKAEEASRNAEKKSNEASADEEAKQKVVNDLQSSGSAEDKKKADDELKAAKEKASKAKEALQEANKAKEKAEEAYDKAKKARDEANKTE